MSEKLVVLYGNDQGANNVLDLVEKSAKEQGFQTLRIPGFKAVISDEHIAVALRADAVVLGVSGDVPEAKFAHYLLAKEPDMDGRMVFIEDFPTSNGNQDPVLRSIGRVSHLCSILPPAENSRELSVYRRVHVVGYPDHWLPAIENIAFGIEARKSGVVRKRRRGYTGSRFVSPGEVVVYVSGFVGFSPEYMRRILEIKEIIGRPVLVHYRAHPSEQNRPELAELIKKRDALFEGRWEIANKEIADAGRDSDTRLIGVSDIVIANPGHVSTFYAGSLRKKMICVMEFVESKAGGTSSYDYRFSGLRTHMVERVSDIREAMQALMTEGSPEQTALEEKQKLNTIPFDPKNPPSYGKNVMEVVKNLI